MHLEIPTRSQWAKTPTLLFIVPQPTHIHMYLLKLPTVRAARPTRNTSPSRFYVFSKAPSPMMRCKPTVVIRNRVRTAPARVCGLWATHESALSVSVLVGNSCIVLFCCSGRASCLNQSALCPLQVTCPATVLCFQEATYKTAAAVEEADSHEAANNKATSKILILFM